eukprot:6434094-Prymnesium_polylepis.1
MATTNGGGRRALLLHSGHRVARPSPDSVGSSTFAALHPTVRRSNGKLRLLECAWQSLKKWGATAVRCMEQLVKECDGEVLGGRVEQLCGPTYGNNSTNGHRLSESRAVAPIQHHQLKPLCLTEYLRKRLWSQSDHLTSTIGKAERAFTSNRVESVAMTNEEKHTWAQFRECLAQFFCGATNTLFNNLSMGFDNTPNRIQLGVSSWQWRLGWAAHDDEQIGHVSG